MIDRGSPTTDREESNDDSVPRRLGLVWVWPLRRLDPLQGARLTIGRDDSATICLHGTRVSRHHAELYRQGPLYVVHDLGSTNGTWLGGKRVEHAPVGPGDVLRVGDWVGVFVERRMGAVDFCELARGLFGGPEIAEVLVPVERAAKTVLPIVLVGATGTGKERFARAIHDASGRSGAFVAVNCAALPDQLAEAELFGYRRGAFTGADRSNQGHFRAAHGGTLFLDEMPELSPSVQAKLLRVVEDGQIVGLGESSPVPVDVRLVSASQAPLAQLVSSRKVREDLAARLGGLQAHLPSLRERRADIAPLFVEFLRRLTGGRPPQVEPRVIEALCLHDWPQNVRSLELATRALLAVHGHETTLRRRHLPVELAATIDDHPTGDLAPPLPRHRREHDLARVQELLQQNGGSVTAAAESLGVSRQRLYRLLGGVDRSRGDRKRDSQQ